MAGDNKQDEIEGKFLQSWNGVEVYYKAKSKYFDIDNQNYKDAQKALYVIASLRRLGYDKQTRAGTQLAQLILSRSKQHGLERGQHFVRISFMEIESGLVLEYVGINDESLKLNSIEVTDEVRAVLDRLVAQPIT